MKTIIVACLAVAISACSVIPEQAYMNRGTPESLLDVSVEQVTVPMDHARGIDDLITWLKQSKPAQANLQCAAQDMLCVNAKRVLTDFGVPVQQVTSSGGNQVVLVYEKIIARDCDQRYVDASQNPYNLNHPSFGCSVAGNTVQMVSDKRQLVNPELLGYMDGTQAAKTYGDYLAGPDKNQDTGSLLDDVAPE